jgi:UDP-glucose 4-epimerase
MSYGATWNRAVVTGGAGFIGSHLADALVDIAEVTVVDDLSNGDRSNVPEAADLVRSDVGDAETLEAALSRADVLFHQAAQISVARSVDAPVQSHETNVDATLQLLELAREHDVRVVVASSCAVYGHPESVPIPETAPFNPTSPYGLEKLTVDHYTRLYHDLYDVETVVLRYFNVYGPRGTSGDYAGVIGIFLDQARNGNPLTVHGDGSQTRDFVHVDDVVEANLRAATTDQVGEAFNIGTGIETSIGDLAETVRDVTGSDSEIVHIAPRDGDIDRSCADTAKARKRLDFEAEVDLHRGLTRLTGDIDNSSE